MAQAKSTWTKLIKNDESALETTLKHRFSQAQKNITEPPKQIAKHLEKMMRGKRKEKKNTMEQENSIIAINLRLSNQNLKSSHTLKYSSQGDQRKVHAVDAT